MSNLELEKYLDYIFDLNFDDNIFLKFFFKIFGEGFHRTMLQYGRLDIYTKGEIMINESKRPFIFWDPQRTI